jgi:cytochrome c55X
MLNHVMKHTFIAFFITVFSLSVSANESLIKSELTQKRQAALIHLLKQDCGSCHGMTLKGGLGPALLPENIKNKPDVVLINTILYGRPGTAMPPWRAIVNEQEASWLTEQLRKGVQP